MHGRWLGRATSVVVLMFAVATMPVVTVRAEASIEVEVSTAGDSWVGVPADQEIVVTNSGSESLADVEVICDEGFILGTPAGPTIVVGNGDDVLDPGEKWLYGCVSALWGAVVTVIARTPTGDSIVGGAIASEPTARPLDIRIASETMTATSGDRVNWVVKATNLTTAVLQYQRAAGAVWADGSRVTASAPMELTDRGSNGDDAWDPNETWQWSYSAVVTADGSFLRAEVEFEVPPALPVAFEQDSESITVTPSPSSTPTATPDTTSPEASTPPDVGDLPETGQRLTSIGVAALLLVFGLALVLLSGRNPSLHND